MNQIKSKLIFVIPDVQNIGLEPNIRQNRMGIGKTVKEIRFSKIHFMGVKPKLCGGSVEKCIGIWA